MLPTTFLVALCAAGCQWAIKPALAQLWPAGRNDPNTVRLLTALLAVVLVLADYAAHAPLSYAVAWGLLPGAAKVFAGAVTGYHVLVDTVPTLLPALHELLPATPEPAPITPQSITIPPSTVGAGGALNAVLPGSLPLVTASYAIQPTPSIVTGLPVDGKGTTPSSVVY